MTGTITNNSFIVQNTIPGGTTEIYTITGTFLDENSFEGIFDMEFVATPQDPLDCVNQSFTMNGSR